MTCCLWWAIPSKWEATVCGSCCFWVRFRGSSKLECIAVITSWRKIKWKWKALVNYSRTRVWRKSCKAFSDVNTMWGPNQEGGATSKSWASCMRGERQSLRTAETTPSSDSLSFPYVCQWCTPLEFRPRSSFSKKNQSKPLCKPETGEVKKTVLQCFDEGRLETHILIPSNAAAS